MITAKPIVLTRTTVTAAAVAHLRQEIISGSLKAGDTLPESRVGELLGVSRAPVREALTMLEREGLIRFDRRGTARVCEFGLDEVRELGLMRLALEPVATRLAAERQPDNEMRALEENLRVLKSAPHLDQITQLDLDFHRLIIVASGNTRLQLAWENLASQFLLVMKRFHHALERRTRTVRETTLRSHTELYRSIVEGPPATAEDLARVHANSWLQELEYSNAFESYSE